MIRKDAAERSELLAQAQRDDAIEVHDDATLLKVAGPPAARVVCDRVATEDLYGDLEVHRPYRGDGGQTLLSSIDATRTRGGRAFLASLIDRPIADTALLQTRQAALRRLPAAAGAAALEEMASLEADVLWMFRYRTDETVRTLYDIAYYKTWFLRFLNRSSWALTGLNVHRIVVSPAVGLLSPLVYFFAPYLVLRAKLGLRLPFKAYLQLMYRSMVAATGAPGSMAWVRYVSCAFSMVFYFQSVFTSFEISSTLRKVCASLTTRVASVSRFFQRADDLVSAVWSPELESAWFPGITPEGGGGPVIRPPGDVRVNFGEGLRAFRQFDYDAAAATMRKVYAVDALTSIPLSMAKMGGCWTEYDDRPAPGMYASGMRHPCVADAVPNTWRLDDMCALVTGPNAGGKSTLLKSLLATALLSQALTIAPCSGGCRMTPFHYLGSHINVPDALQQSSLFEAEMHRAKATLDALKALGPGRRALVVMDEIFSSTNPVEGIAGAFAVAKHMAACRGALCVISTHYLYLCRLPRDTGGRFANFRMPVRLDGATGSVAGHPYRLRRGVSRQYVALELLKDSGFGADLVADAIQVKRDLLGPPPPPAEPTKTGTGSEKKKNKKKQTKKKTTTGSGVEKAAAAAAAAGPEETDEEEEEVTPHARARGAAEWRP
jgi:hypothetical protein